MKLSFLFIIFLLILPFTSATDIFYFQSEDCDGCRGMFNFLVGLGKRDDSITFNVIHLTTDQNIDMFNFLSDKYLITNPEPPIVFIGDTAYVGYNQQIRDLIKEKIDICTIDTCISPTEISIDDSLHIEKGETPYLVMYKFGRGIMQGILVIALIGIVLFLAKHHKTSSEQKRRIKKMRMGRTRHTRKLK